MVTVTAVLTGLMHLAFSSNFAGITTFGLPGNIAFLLNGVGFFVIVILMYFVGSMEGNRSILRYVLAAWTLGSIVGWLIYHPETGMPYLDSSLMNKVIEVVLLVFLARDMMGDAGGAE
ncbi:MAG: hypothetical protein ACXAE3_08660 [Candidatus Kariarchaeaceae archaeon]